MRRGWRWKMRLVLVAVGAWVSADGAEATRRPNIVFILTDDQRWDMMGLVQREQGERARFPWLKTPHLDRLAEEGVRFRNAFVVNSLCSPSRATFLTGMYGHANGIVNNHTPLSGDRPNWALELRKAGYATAYFGKWHMGNQAERPGFGHVASFVGQGVYFGCKFLVNGTETKTEGYVDDVSTDFAIAFMREHKDRPFGMVVGLKATHGPFDPPPRRANEYEGEIPRPTPNLSVRAVYLGGVATGREGDGTKINWGYLRCISGIDDNVGRVVAAIDELGLSDDTILVFAGDNGYYLREHQLGDKRTAYEESLRIPLLFRYPRIGARGTVVDAMVLNTDLAPTLLDLVGIPPPGPRHGRSWRPLLSGDVPPDWRKAWLYCYFRERGFQAPMTTAVRTETAKLIRYPGRDDWTEMFDLVADPYETRNLFGEPSHAALRAELEREFDRQAEAIGFHVPDFADQVGADAETGAAPAPRRNAWVLEYRFDRDEGGKVQNAAGPGPDGMAHGAPLADGRDGGRARAFDGKGYIEVPKSPELDPSRGPWTVEATLLPDDADGVVLARGGKTNGYILYLSGGRPTFAVASNGTLSKVEGKAPVTGRWVTVRAAITADRHLGLWVDGKPAARAPLKAFIADDPNDGMQIGADLKTPVLADGPHGFRGRIAAVRIFSGEAAP